MRKPSPNDVAELAASLGRDLDERQAMLLAEYLGTLAKWNRSMNLVGADRWRDALSNLVADSWHLADFLVELSLPDSPRTLDLGAGAGLPGIPLRVFWEAGEYTLVEIRKKRVAFMRFVLAHMRLERTVVAGCRVEELPQGSFPVDLVLSRAFMPWDDLLALVGPWLTPEGSCVVMANEKPPREFPGWTITGVAGYPAPGGRRYFWSLSPASISK
ncbi:16S rRNA (guanine(527)-N(7))-methyltransferase RsmG [Desulfovibrio ferrophilus]|uniref:Ribosomal RNA small subunit methyltransferase G n=1 Tax=Desulfovibrio ferrophilus TaxID=241368 RepID=A0A2Z6AVP5_9BACT|nr:RsmG family class I SAM-dependent methyltransferase [Desulfovibrio ferrophilus]BBD07301.1 ribosomal RNA small subunit methyltransferase G [Desulfovibrio ferrophilus]